MDQNKITELSDFIDSNLDECRTNNAKLQVVATLILAAQVERVADALEFMLSHDAVSVNIAGFEK